MGQLASATPVSASKTNEPRDITTARLIQCCFLCWQTPSRTASPCPPSTLAYHLRSRRSIGNRDARRSEIVQIRPSPLSRSPCRMRTTHALRACDSSMCGIAGIISPGASPDGLERQLDRMWPGIASRGPDGRGQLVAPGVALLHSRLAIIDLSTGDQPIWNEQRTVGCVFNGEIYNYRGLREPSEPAGTHCRRRATLKC